MAAIRRVTPPVLLIDEVDRAAEEFEAFLLELLRTFRSSNTELGTITATSIPARRAHLQRHPRAFRRVAPALPLSLSRIPRSRSRGGHHPRPHAPHRRRARFADRPHGRGGAQGRLAQGARASPKRSTGRHAGRLDVHDLRQEPEAVYETMMCLLKTQEDRARMTREVSDRLLGKVA